MCMSLQGGVEVSLQETFLAKPLMGWHMLHCWDCTSVPSFERAFDVRDVMATVPGVKGEGVVERHHAQLRMPVGAEKSLIVEGLQKQHPPVVERIEQKVLPFFSANLAFK